MSDACVRWDKVDLFHWVLDVQCGQIVLQIKAKELKKPWGGDVRGGGFHKVTAW